MDDNLLPRRRLLARLKQSVAEFPVTVLLGARQIGKSTLAASWEGFAIEQVLARWETDRAWFWSTYQGAELDLLVEHGGRRYGFEFKHSDAPSATQSMQVALADLKLEHLWVVSPGTKSYRLSPDITVVPITRLPDAPA